ncbi:hypothetical protein ACP4OV_021111 [Aristida adscensionis]
MSNWRSAESRGAARRRRDDRPETERDGTNLDGLAARDASRPGHGLEPGGVLSFGSMPGRRPWLAFAPPHPWALELPRAPPFAPRPVGDPSPWSVPGEPAGEVPFFFGFGGGGGAAAATHGDIGAHDVPPECAADGWASCLARVVSVREAGRNFLVSPLSFHAALALVAAGACGDTQRELLGFLGSPSLDELRRAAATQLVGRLRGLPQTSFACGVWVDRSRVLMPEFMETAASRYAAVAEPADFAGAAEQARQRVNAFVSEATKGLIGDILPRGSVDPSTVVVLANALYFKGSWALPFDPSRTFTAPFHLPNGDTVHAPFMTTSLFEQQQVAVFPGFKALKMPYKIDGGGAGGGMMSQAAAFYMLVLLPDGKTLKVSDLYDKAVSTPGFIRTHTPVAQVPVGRFMVPKFKFTFEFEATEDMKRLGVSRAFGGGDFSGMVTGGDGLFISGVYHKATIEVDELGTVAAAATAVCICQCAPAPKPPVDFVADRPFLFAITEERTGAVLVLGHVVNPLAE